MIRLDNCETNTTTERTGSIDRRKVHPARARRGCNGTSGCLRHDSRVRCDYRGDRAHEVADLADDSRPF